VQTGHRSQPYPKDRGNKRHFFASGAYGKLKELSTPQNKDKKCALLA